MTILDCRPFLAVGVSFIAAVLIAFSRRWPNLRETWSVIASVLKFGIILSMLPAVLDGNQYQWTLCQITDTVGLTLRTDPAGMIFAVLASMLWVPMNNSIEECFTNGFFRIVLLIRTNNSFDR